MTVEFLDDEAIADIAFKVRTNTLEQIFIVSCDTIFNLQTNTDLLDSSQSFPIDLTASSYERLLYNVLSEILYYRDSEMFFGKTTKIKLDVVEGKYMAKGNFIGSEFNENIHSRGNEVKAITMHDFYLKKNENGWEAYILVDI